jgi:hypothetical protein
MAYTSGDTIEATHYNDFAASVNAVWGTGTGDRGYGQTSTLSTVAAGNTVTATQWATLISRIDSMRNHQGGAASGVTQPTTGDSIEAIAAISTNIGLVDTNRLDNNPGVTSLSTANATGATGWTNNAVRECTFTFASANQMRYFFNAGGTITFNAISSSFSGNTKSDNWDTIANAASATITNSTFWTNLSTSNYTVTSNTGSGADYGSNVLYLQARLNAAAGSSTVITLRGYFVDGAADGFDDTVSGTARIDASANGSNVTYLANVWGTPTGANNVTVTQS